MAIFVAWEKVSSTFVDTRTEKQQANSVQPQRGLALWERLFCEVTTGVLGLQIGKSRLSVAVADFGFSLKVLSGISLGMTGPRTGSCHSSLSPSSGMESWAGKGSRVLPTIPSTGNSLLGETGSGRGAYALNIPEQRAGEVWVWSPGSEENHLCLSCGKCSLSDGRALSFGVKHGFRSHLCHLQTV